MHTQQSTTLPLGKNGIPSFVPMWMELQIILLSKIRQAWGHMCHVISYVNLKRLISEMKRTEREEGVDETRGEAVPWELSYSERVWWALVKWDD